MPIKPSRAHNYSREKAEDLGERLQSISKKDTKDRIREEKERERERERESEERENNESDF